MLTEKRKHSAWGVKNPTKRSVLPRGGARLPSRDSARPPHPARGKAEPSGGPPAARHRAPPTQKSASAAGTAREPGAQRPPRDRADAGRGRGRADGWGGVRGGPGRDREPRSGRRRRPWTGWPRGVSGEGSGPGAGRGGRAGGGVKTGRGRGAEVGAGARSPTAPTWAGRPLGVDAGAGGRRKDSARPAAQRRAVSFPRVAASPPSPQVPQVRAGSPQPRGRYAGAAAAVLQLEHSGRVRRAQAAADLRGAGGAQRAGHQPPEFTSGAGGFPGVSQVPVLLRVPAAHLPGVPHSHRTRCPPPAVCLPFQWERERGSALPRGVCGLVVRPSPAEVDHRSGHESEYLHQRGQQVCAAAVPVEDQGLGSRERPHLEPRLLHLRHKNNNNFNDHQ